MLPTLRSCPMTSPQNHHYLHTHESLHCFIFKVPNYDKLMIIRSTAICGSFLTSIRCGNTWNTGNSQPRTSGNFLHKFQINLKVGWLNNLKPLLFRQNKPSLGAAMEMALDSESRHQDSRGGRFGINQTIHSVVQLSQYPMASKSYEFEQNVLGQFSVLIWKRNLIRTIVIELRTTPTLARKKAITKTKRSVVCSV